MRHIIIFLFVLFVCPTINAQYNLSDLIGKKWVTTSENDFSEVYELINIYSIDKLTNTLILKKQDQSIYMIESAMYLSDKPDDIFDKNKIGKCIIGSYIVVQDNNLTSVSKIEKLTDKELILLPIITKNKIQISSEPLVPVKYVAE